MIFMIRGKIVNLGKASRRPLVDHSVLNRCCTCAMFRDGDP